MSGKQANVTDEERLRHTAASSQGKLPKGAKRKCRWDEKAGRLVFKDGGARQMKDFRSVRNYVEKHGYELVEWNGYSWE